MILTILQLVLRAFGFAEWAEKIAQRNDDRKIGQQQQRLADAEKALKDAENAQEVHDNVVHLPDSALDSELRSGSKPDR
jgi:hypothetical protein